MIKKIMYIGFQYEYGIQSTEAINNKGFFQNFKKMGFDITPVWYDGRSNEEIQEIVISTANKINPDMIFFILQKDQIQSRTLKQLKENHYFIVNWFGDDHWRFDSFSKFYANYFDACITTHKFSIDKYKLIGQNNIIKSEWASLASEIDYQNIEYKYDVSFVGSANAYRKWFVKKLESKGIKVHCFGDRWDNGKISYEQMEAIFSSSKINLSISNSTQYDVRYLLSKPRNIINTLRNPKAGSHVKARNFEIPTHGGFQITEYAPCLEDYFDLGKDVICYKDIDDAEMLIKYYLYHDKEREMIKCSGVQRARKSHTFEHRIKDFMEIINSLWKAKKHH